MFSKTAIVAIVIGMMLFPYNTYAASLVEYSYKALENNKLNIECDNEKIDVKVSYKIKEEKMNLKIMETMLKK